MENRNPTTLLVDTHVHFYRCFDPDAFFSSALENFAAFARKLQRDENSIGCVLLTETSSEDFFSEFVEKKEHCRGKAFSLRKTEEADSLIVQSDGRNKLILIAGQQIVTRERLEILALCCRDKLSDGLPVKKTLKAIEEHDAIPVLPWGVGKWLFHRGRLVAGLVDSVSRGPLFLGDNSGRLAMSRPPSLFRRGASKGIHVLAGTDPLPFPSQASRVGCYGVVLSGDLDDRRPTQSIKKLLGEMTAQPRIYGNRESVVGFCRNLVRMQLRKRFSNKNNC